jgi:hypothetical protein
MKKIQSIITQANLILSDHLNMTDDAVGDQAAQVKADVLIAAGFPLKRITEDSWLDYIESDGLPWEYRKTLIALDDCVDFHTKTRYM